MAGRPPPNGEGDCCEGDCAGKLGTEPPPVMLESVGNGAGAVAIS